jgi:phosphatidylserine decarboxylase
MLAKGSAPWLLTTTSVSIAASASYVAFRLPYTNIIAMIAIATTVFFIFFFRDPEREITLCDRSMVAPADGKVVDIRGRKICIFMNFQNVHVNRFPLGGTVISIIHKKGGYMPAFCKDSHRNERSHLLIDTEHGPVEVIQIAGAAARRIVSYVKEGDILSKGQRFGMIRFGSRVDVTIPDNFEIACEKGSKLYAGKTVIAKIKSKDVK